MFIYNIVDPFVKATQWYELSEINIFSITLRLVLAVICGGLLGFERALKLHAAGFRTYILVCLGATIAMLTNEFLAKTTGLGDGARLGAQVISGIGFLGAGTIMFTSKNQVKGLTTAAGLWACACLGLTIGIGFYTLTFIATIVISIVLAFLTPIERLFVSHSKLLTIHIELNSLNSLKDLVNFLREMHFQILSLENNQSYAQSGLSVYSIRLKVLDKTHVDHKLYIGQLNSLPYVNFAEEIN